MANFFKSRKFKIILIVLLIAFSSYFALGLYFFNYTMIQQSDYKYIEKPIELPYTDKYIINDGLKLHAREFGEPSEKVAILLHGYHGFSDRLYQQVRFFVNKGFRVLLTDHRAHGKSEGRHIGAGYLDSLDLKKWISELYPDKKILLYGGSMGAATALMAIDNGLPKNIYAIIADSPYDKIENIFEFQLKEQFGLPPFPVMQAGNFISKLLKGFDFRAIDVTDFINETEVPILILHSEKDEFTPIRLSENIVNAYKGKNMEFVRFKQYPHFQADVVNPEEYYQILANFIDKVESGKFLETTTKNSSEIETKK